MAPKYTSSYSRLPNCCDDIKMSTITLFITIFIMIKSLGVSSFRCRFCLAGIQTSYGRGTVCRFVRRELAQVVVGEFRLFGHVGQRFELSRGRVQRGSAILETQFSESGSTSAGLQGNNNNNELVDSEMSLVKI